MPKAIATAVVLAALLAATPAVAGTTAIGESGELYVVRAGAYGDLFPQGDEAAAETAVLALDVVRTESEPERHLVPGTHGDEVETFPALTIHKATNTVYLVWEARTNPYSMLHLVSLGADGWSEVIEYSGDPFSAKSSPQLTVTRHRALTLDGDGDGEPVELDRSILHLVWWDDAGVGSRALYTPLIVEADGFIDFNPVFVLEDFVPPVAADRNGDDASPGLYRTPRIQPGRDGESVAIGFTSLSTEQLIGLEIRVLPSDLMELSDRGRAQIILIGARTTAWEEEVSGVVTELEELGSKILEPDLVGFIGGRLGDLLLTADPAEELASLAERGRAQIILIGARTTMRGTDLDDPEHARIIEIEREEGDDGPTHGLLFRVAAERSVPPTPDKPVKLFLSDDGAEMLIAWDVPGGVRYRESTPDGWEPRLTVAVSDELSSATVYSMLEQRVRR